MLVKPIKPIQGNIFSIDERLNSRIITDRIDADVQIGYCGISDCNLTRITQSVALRERDCCFTIDDPSDPHRDPPARESRMSMLATTIRIQNEIKEISQNKPCSHGSSRPFTSLTRYPNRVDEGDAIVILHSRVKEDTEGKIQNRKTLFTG